MSKLCSCIVPCFNEEEVIPLYYEEMQKVRKQEEGKIDFEIIFIDDGSKDKTLEVIKKLSEQDECIHYVSFSRNFGKEAAMYAGFEHANGEYVVTRLVATLSYPSSSMHRIISGIKCGGS